MSVKQLNFNSIWKKLLDEKAVDTIGYFADRWADEQEYEDFNDYKEAVQKTLTKVLGKAEVTRMTKRPFGVTFKHKCLEITLKFLRSGKVKASCK